MGIICRAEANLTDILEFNSRSPCLMFYLKKERSCFSRIHDVFSMTNISHRTNSRQKHADDSCSFFGHLFSIPEILKLTGKLF